jgi:hypothetical protein
LERWIRCWPGGVLHLVEIERRSDTKRKKLRKVIISDEYGTAAAFDPSASGSNNFIFYYF